MPQALAAIPAIATSISASVGGWAAAATGSIAFGGAVATATYAAVEVGIYVGISFAANAAFGPKPPPMASVQTPYKGSLPPRQSGFGRTRISGPYMLFEAGLGVSFDVVALHDGEVDGFEIFYLNDDVVEVDGATGGVWCPGDTRKYAYGGPPGDRVFIETRVGANPSTALARPINAAIPGAWTSLHRGDGIACLSLTCKQSKQKFQQEDFPNGVPLPSVVGRLQKVYDPRLGEVQGDASTYAWSDNPVLALLSYLTDAAGGMGLSYARRIAPTVATWKAAAADCDLPMQLLSGSTEARYACGGIYQHTASPAEVINQLLQSFDGWLSQRGDGALVVLPGRYIPPTVVFRDEHVVAYSVQHFLGDEEAINELVPSYADPNSSYNVIDAGAWRDEADISARGQLRSEAFALPWVQSPSRSRRLAKRKMSRLTAELRGSITTNAYGFAGLGERYLTLKIRENASLANLIVEVASVRMDLANMQVTFDWVEADPDIDAWDRFSEEQPGDDAAARVEPTPLSAPTIDTLTPVYTPAASSDTGARLQLDITAPVEEDVQWLARWRVQGTTEWHEAAYTDVDDGPAVTLITGFVPAAETIEVQTAYQTAGSISPWSATETVVTAAPSTVFDDAVGALIEAGVTRPVTATEALTAGNLVNVYSTGGTARVRKADNSAVGKPANGFVKANVSNGAVADVSLPGGIISGFTGLTDGATYFLGTAGAGTNTAPSTEGSGNLVQEIGFALSDTEIFFAPQRGTII